MLYWPLGTVYANAINDTESADSAWRWRVIEKSRGFGTLSDTNQLTVLIIKINLEKVLKLNSLSTFLKKWCF